MQWQALLHGSATLRCAPAVIELISLAFASLGRVLCELLGVFQCILPRIMPMMRAHYGGNVGQPQPLSALQQCLGNVGLLIRIRMLVHCCSCIVVAVTVSLLHVTVIVAVAVACWGPTGCTAAGLGYVIAWSAHGTGIPGSEHTQLGGKATECQWKSVQRRIHVCQWVCLKTMHEQLIPMPFLLVAAKCPLCVGKNPLSTLTLFTAWWRRN